MNDDASVPSNPLGPVSAGRQRRHHRSIADAMRGKRLRVVVMLAASLLAMTAMAGVPVPTSSDTMIDVGGTVLQFRVTPERSGHMISDDRPDFVLSTVVAMVDAVRQADGTGGQSGCGAPLATGAPR